MTATATRNECATCGVSALPGMRTACGCDDTLTLFQLDAPAAVRVVLPTSPTETPEAFRARIDAHHAEAVAFFDGFTLTESETLA